MSRDAATRWGLGELKLFVLAWIGGTVLMFLHPTSAWYFSNCVEAAGAPAAGFSIPYCVWDHTVTAALIVCTGLVVAKFLVALVKWIVRTDGSLYPWELIPLVIPASLVALGIEYLARSGRPSAAEFLLSVLHTWILELGLVLLVPVLLGFSLKAIIRLGFGN